MARGTDSMKFRILLATSLVAVLVLAVASLSLASGSAGSKDLRVNRIVIDDTAAGKSTVGFVSLENTGRGLDDVRIRITVPELGLVASTGPFDVSSGEAASRRLLINIPEGAEAGEYWARIVVSNDDIKRVKHRPFVVS